MENFILKLQWWDVAASHDIILMSSAAHIDELIKFPNEIEALSSENATSLIDVSAVRVANKLRQLKLKPDAVVVYMTSSGGIYNFSTNCTLKPEDTPLPYSEHFNWHMIPYMQQVYVQAIRQAMSEKKQPFLVLDMQYLMQMRRGCRGDYIHSLSTVKASPYFNTWMVLYNLLLEYKQET